MAYTDPTGYVPRMSTPLTLTGEPAAPAAPAPAATGAFQGVDPAYLQRYFADQNALGPEGSMQNLSLLVGALGSNPTAGPVQAVKDVYGNDIAGGATVIPGLGQALTPEGTLQNQRAVSQYSSEQQRAARTRAAALIAAGATAGTLATGGLGAGFAPGSAAAPGATGAVASTGAAGTGLATPGLTAIPAATGAVAPFAGAGAATTAAGAVGAAAPIVGAGTGAGTAATAATGATGLGSKILGALDTAGGGGDDIFSKILGGVNVAGALGAAAGGNDLSDLLGLTNRDLENQVRTAEFSPGQVALPGGAGAGVDPTTGAVTSSLGDLDPIRRMLLSTASGQTQDPEIAAALKSYGMGSFGSTGDLEAQRLAQLREQAQPYEQKLFQGINQNLFSRGRLGAEDSATGEAYSGFARGLSEADTARQIAAGEYAQTAQNQRYQQGIQAFGLGDQFNSSALQRMLASTGGAMDLTKLSALPLEVQLAFASAKSNAQLGVGTNLIGLNSAQASPADLLARYLQGGT